MTEKENSERTIGASSGDSKSRRQAIGRVLTLAAAVPMAALLFKPGKAAASSA